ncbi:MAG: entericidin A/B family lipoprotein [Phycisphaerales bacterium]|jgi:predicted small secreted protein
MERRTEVKPGLVRTALTGIFVAMAVAAAACNTMEGAGKDVEKAGEAIEDAADG